MFSSGCKQSRFKNSITIDLLYPLATYHYCVAGKSLHIHWDQVMLIYRLIYGLQPATHCQTNAQDVEEKERKHQHMWVLSKYECALRETKERVLSEGDNRTRWSWWYIKPAGQNTNFNVRTQLKIDNEVNKMTKYAGSGGHWANCGLKWCKLLMPSYPIDTGYPKQRREERSLKYEHSTQAKP